MTKINDLNFINKKLYFQISNIKVKLIQFFIKTISKYYNITLKIN